VEDWVHQPEEDPEEEPEPELEEEEEEPWTTAVLMSMTFSSMRVSFFRISFSTSA